MKLIDTGRSEYGWSTIGSLLACPQRWAWEQAERAEKVESNQANALQRGTLVHQGLAHHYIHRVEGVQSDEFYGMLAALEASEIGSRMMYHDAEQYNYLRKLLMDYVEAFTETDDRFVTLAVEKQFVTNIDGHKLTYKADLILEDPATGKVYFVDHKTTSSTLNAITSRYTLSGQMLFAQLIGRATHKENWGGVLINGVRTNEKIVNSQFGRFPLESAPAALAQFRDTILHAFELRDRLAGRPVDTYPRAFNETVCESKYGQCAFFYRCQNG